MPQSAVFKGSLEDCSQKKQYSLANLNIFLYKPMQVPQNRMDTGFAEIAIRIFSHVNPCNSISNLCKICVKCVETV